MNFLTILSFFAVFDGIFGALLISLNNGFELQGYIFFLVSSILWIIYGYITKQKGLVIMNFVFSLINLNGIINFY